MSRKSQKLTPLAVSKITKPGLYGDGAGLWLQVSKGGVKSWLFRYMRNGKAREMGLGALHTVTLKEARDKALEARKCLDAGKDPIEERRAEGQRKRLEEAKNTTFRQCAESYIEMHKAGWRNVKHAGQWQSTLKTYAYPVIGDLSVAAVDTDLVMQVLEPIWKTKTETASRVRSRIELILDWAEAKGQRTAANPARWRGNLSALLPKRAKVQRVEHFAAMDYRQIPAFMERLRGQEGIAARGLELLILCAVRTNEVIGATWNEIDLKEASWLIPGKRMKAERDHRVPLSPRTVEILRAMEKIKHSDYVLPSIRPCRPLSNMAFLKLLERMQVEGVTVHGFRSAFRDWCAEQTSFSREVVEQALAHTISNRTEAAYFRSDLFAKRRKLMEAWAKYCSQPVAAEGENVVEIKRHSRKPEPA